MPLIILHKICLIGPSEAVKEVRVKLTHPRAVEGKTSPVRDRVNLKKGWFNWFELLRILDESYDFINFCLFYFLDE